MGVTLTIPENWDLVQAKGNRFDGYLRFDEESLLRCEIQWTLVSAGRVVLDELVERYMESLKKHLQKQGKTVSVQRDIKLVSRRQVKRNVRTFSWDAGQVGYGMMWFCEDCRRSLVAQVVGYSNEPVKDWARQIFLSLSDHSEGDWEEWSLYGFRFDVPVGWQLSTTELVPGRLRFSFKQGDYTLMAERWGPALVLLKGKVLEEFAARVLPKEIRERFEIGYRLEPFKGHPAMELMGKDKRSGSLLHVFLRRLRLGLPFPQFLGWLWHCDLSNRLYLVAGAIAPEHEPLLERFVQSVQCHDNL